jgi:sarcosine oxidase
MARQALPLWRQLEAESGRTLLLPTGGLDMGPDLDAHAAALTAGGAPFERLHGAAAMARFEGLRFTPDARLIYQADGATIAAETTWRALVDAAVARGAELRVGAPVVSLVVVADMVEVGTPEETYRAPVAVVTAGGWSRGLLAGVGIDLPTVVTRETVAYFRLPDELPMPPTLLDWTSQATYALASPGQGLKAGQHLATLAVDLEREGADRDGDGQNGPGEVSAESIAHLSAWVAEHYPAADPVPHRAETCLYTNTADEHFILERHGPIVVGSACSGHGFKFAPLIGQRLADLALSSTMPTPRRSEGSSPPG